MVVRQKHLKQSIGAEILTGYQLKILTMKAMVLFSGGIDSTTCLGMAVEKYGPENVIALSISYGQKHTKEIEASDKIVKYYNVEHIYLDLAKITHF